MKIKSKSKGISLIVLVITILVLSILAATVIITISNTNVIEETNKTVFKANLKSYKEAFEMYVTSETMKDISFDRRSLDGTYADNADTFNKIFGKVESKYQQGLKIQDGELVYDTEDETEKEIAKDLDMQFKELWVTYVKGVPIPNEFYYVGGTKETGLVISDDVSDKNRGVDENDLCVGNQFVWVPVDYTPSGLKDENGLDTGFTAVFRTGSAVFDSTTGTYKMTGPLTYEEEPYTMGYSTEKAEYYAMCESVQKYGGFYIARFEAGDGALDISERRDGASDVGIVVSKKEAVVYNYVDWGDRTYDHRDNGSRVFISANVRKYFVSSVYIMLWGAVGCDYEFCIRQGGYCGFEGLGQLRRFH